MSRQLFLSEKSTTWQGNWNDTTTYANVANTLKGFACDWLFATADMLDWMAAQLTWTNLKPRFQKQFATQMDDKQIIDGLSNLAMGHNETTGEILAPQILWTERKGQHYGYHQEY